MGNAMTLTRSVSSTRLIESALFLEIPRVRCDGFGGRKCRRRAVVRITTQQRSGHLMFWSGLVCACVKHAIERLKRMEEQA